MRIGIITWYTGSNYGTNFQAIALQWYLRNNGHEVSLIDYNEDLVRWIFKKTFIQKVKNLPGRCAAIYANKKYKNEIAKRDEFIKKTIHEKCNFTKKANTVEEFVNICNKFDLLIVGSDQLWNPTWYVPLYFLDFDGLRTRRISYAPSTGVNSMSYEVARKIEHGLKKFSAISVREEKGKELLEKISPVLPKVVVDPTLLLNEGEWEVIFPKEERLIKDRYVLSIFLTDNMNHWKAAKSFAKRKGFQHVIVPYMGISYFQSKHVQADTDLAKMLNLIRNAEYVITDSFHMTVFSIIHKKNFYVFERFQENSTGSTNSRVRNILKMAKLEDRMMGFNSRRIVDLKDIDYNTSYQELGRQIEISKKYLKDAIR